MSCLEIWLNKSLVHWIYLYKNTFIRITIDASNAQYLVTEATQSKSLSKINSMWSVKKPFQRFDELFLQALGQHVECPVKPV